ncbi:transposase [Neorhizobium galegae]|nr:transposase [Neorhizobium galegae]MCQ1839299.1 transposase [Neorhizobium galegae]
MTPPDLQLPDDVEKLKAMVLSMADKAARADALESEVADQTARNAHADERIERPTQILKALDRARFGATSRRSIFERFLTDGRIELDSNIVERAIRPQTTTRRNSLFAGSDAGAENWATIATLLQTCLCRARHKAVYADRRTMPSNQLFCQPFRYHSGRLVGVV